MTNFGTTLAKGAGWTMLLRLTVRSIGFVSTIILARLLLPKDFGLIALATSLIAIVEVLGSFGFDFALIQNQKAERRHYDTAWTLQLGYSVLSAAVIATTATPVATFFSEPRLGAVMLVLALGVLIGGFSNIGIIGLRKELQMGRDFAYMVGRKVASFTVTVGLAFATHSYWSLVAGIVAGRIMEVVLSYAMHSFRPRLSLSGARDLIRFSKWMFVNNIAVYVNNRGDDLIVGRVMGAGPLGVYTLAYEISNLPLTEMVAPINRVLLPGYSKIADDTAQLRHYFVRVFAAIAVISVPSAVGIALLAHDITVVVLGEKWLAAAPIMQVMALFGLSRSLTSNNGTLFIAAGSPQITTIFAVGRAVILIPAVWFAVARYGLIGGAWAHALASVLSAITSTTLICRRFNVRLLSLLDALWRPGLAAALMAAGVLFLRAQIAALPSALALLILMGAGVLIYGVSVLGLWRISGRPEGAETYIIKTVLRRQIAA